MAGGIAAAVVITMVGVEVVAITTAGRAVGIAVGIKPFTRRGRLSLWPLSFPAPLSAIAPERPRFDTLPGSKLPNECVAAATSSPRVSGSYPPRSLPALEWRLARRRL